MVLEGQAETEAFGARLAAILAPAVNATGGREGAWIVHLHGQLGAGKTTLVRGLLRALGHGGPVKSPTYTLVEPYTLSCASPAFDGQIHHFDLYRLVEPEELELLGYRDVLAQDRTLCLLEWPEKGEGFLARPDLSVELSVVPDGRSVTVTCHSVRADELSGLIKSIA